MEYKRYSSSKFLEQFFFENSWIQDIEIIDNGGL
jgi:hypothetical protein